MTRTAADPLSWLAAAAESRRARGLQRATRVRPEGVLDLAGNDYLGLSRAPEVVAAAAEAAHRWGAGSTGSRLVTGTTALHLELEEALARHTGTAAALVLSSGYLANLAVVTALSGPGSLVVSDAENHASVVDACRLSRARVVVVPHGDADAARRALRERVEERALLVTEAVFSVSGRLAGEPDVVLTATLSKALGSQGGAVLGPAAVRAHLLDTARPFIFDTALAPPSVAAALAALRRVDDPLVDRLRRVTASLAAALGVAAGDGAVVPVHVGDASTAVAARDACLRAGVLVGCFRPPSVPPGRARLRLTGRADLTPDDVRRAADVVRRAVAA